MSKNYDQIATVDIDIATPIVDDTSFDNLLIMGPEGRRSMIRMERRSAQVRS